MNTEIHNKNRYVQWGKAALPAYTKGESLTPLALELGISRQRLHQCLIKYLKSVYSKEDIAKIKRRIKENKNKALRKVQETTAVVNQCEASLKAKDKESKNLLRLEEVLAMRHAGCTVPAIAAKMGCAVITVYRLLKKGLAEPSEILIDELAEDDENGNN